MALRSRLVQFFVFFVLASSACAQEQTPEKAVEKFISRMQALDMKSMVNCFAGDAYVDGYDFKTFARRAQAISPTMMLPNKYPVYREINRAGRLGEIAGKIKRLLLVATSREAPDMTRAIASDAEIDKYVEEINPAVTAKTTLVRIETPDKYPAKRAKEWARQLGADDATERIAYLSIKNGMVAIPFTLLKYKNGWYIGALDAPFAGMDGPQKRQR